MPGLTRRQGWGAIGATQGADMETPHRLTLHRLTLPDTPPEITRPDPHKVIDGNPEHSTWNVEDRDGLYCGLWQSTPGTWRVSYGEWEYCHILQGISVLTDADDTAETFRAGDSFVIRPGFVGTWCVVETTLKEYVIRT